ncbi:MAG TPA: hypothetical protein VFB38_09530 [Chthonomonadaceae bacterium]|nr:hypothetical protein [Chthonomonadaceae bacterium]
MRWIANKVGLAALTLVIGGGTALSQEASTTAPPAAVEKPAGTPSTPAPDQATTNPLVAGQPPSAATSVMQLGRFFSGMPSAPILQRPVDVQMDRATVRQLAEALSRASGVSVRVDKLVPDQTRITVDARGVALGTVLEAVARQANLMIAPDFEEKEIVPENEMAPNPNASNAKGAALKGIVLKTWPLLKVSGQPEQTFVGPNAPWSDGWFRPDFLVRWSNPGPYTGRVLDGQTALLSPTSPFGSAPTSFFAEAGFSPFALASLTNNTVVVAEPGQDERGEAGLWLTVYRWDGAQLRKVSATFHRLAARAKAKPGAAMGGLGGFGGGGLGGGGSEGIFGGGEKR